MLDQRALDGASQMGRELRSGEGFSFLATLFSRGRGSFSVVVGAPQPAYERAETINASGFRP